MVLPCSSQPAKNIAEQRDPWDGPHININGIGLKISATLNLTLILRTKSEVLHLGRIDLFEPIFPSLKEKKDPHEIISRKYK